MGKGCLALILHAHLPYVRHPEDEDSLEEHWFYEATTEAYIPLLIVLEGLVKDQIDFRLTLSITPTLVSMLDDPLLQSCYLRRLDHLIELAEKEIHRTRFQPEFNTLAQMYHQKFVLVNGVFLHRYHGNLIQGFKELQDLGEVEIVASAATHGYLLNRSAEVMERLTRNHRQARGLTKKALNQALREMLLAQSSDWAFIIKSAAMADYAVKRIKNHLLRFGRLSREIEGKTIDRAWLSAIEKQDNIFPHLDYSVFS